MSPIGPFYRRFLHWVFSVARNRAPNSGVTITATVVRGALPFPRSPRTGARRGGWADNGCECANGKAELALRFRASLDELCNGGSLRAERFRYSLLTFDLVTVAIFIIDSLTPPVASMVVVDVTIAVLLMLDFLARLVVARPRWRYLLDPVTIADLVVISTLLLPLLLENWAFLRILHGRPAAWSRCSLC
jgi:hypothetical protein